jgi:hypothetical protein
VPGWGSAGAGRWRDGVDFFAVAVTDPKGSRRETPVMTSDTRFHVRRRDGALARLQGLTATAAVAGVAGTAVFGAVAAFSWSGNPNAKTAADVGVGSTPANTGVTQPQTESEENPFLQTNPNTSSSGQATNPGTARIRPSFGGRSHATTGGSG